MLLLVVNLALLVLDVIQAAVLRRRPHLLWALSPLGFAVAFGVSASLHSLGWFPSSFFSLFHAQAWVLFLHLPLVLAFAASQGARPRGSRLAAGTLALALVSVGVYAGCVEPRRLQVTHVQLPLPMEKGLRIALVTDLQTSRVTGWERRVVRTLQDQAPDLILYGGDYFQDDWTRPWGDPAARRPAHMAELRDLLATLDPPLGSIAVRGDVDKDDWTTLFDSQRVTACTETCTVDLGPLVVTALSRFDTRSQAPPVPSLDRPHVVLGHSPDFALAHPPADLLLAGHTHGGQVRLPFVGPLLTFSRVPKAWAQGRTDLPHGSVLLVSRGVGLERIDAPRLRFLCPPELVFVDLVPGP